MLIQHIILLSHKQINILSHYHIITMEPEVKIFLKAILNSMSLGIAWLSLNVYFGIKQALFFPEYGIGIWHIVFYLLSATALFFIVKHLIKVWKKVPKFGTGTDN